MKYLATARPDGSGSVLELVKGKPMTLGEYRVSINFNPSENPHVDDIKRKAADLIDLCHRHADKTNDPEVGRLLSLAMTHIEDAAMWAVNAVTKQPKT